VKTETREWSPCAGRQKLLAAGTGSSVEDFDLNTPGV